MVITEGGPAGNEQLTAMTGSLLLVLLAALGVTIVFIGQLISEHLFLGLLLLGPVALKLASTGYRFARYYTGSRTYRMKEPPEPWLRIIAPGVVLTTLAVFASGVVLLSLGASRRGPWVEIHKVTFIAWIMFTGLHVLGHLLHLPRSLRAADADPALTRGSNGAVGRWVALSGALLAGLILAIAFIPDFSSWTAHGAFLHHDR